MARADKRFTVQRAPLGFEIVMGNTRTIGHYNDEATALIVARVLNHYDKCPVVARSAERGYQSVLDELGDTK